METGPSFVAYIDEAGDDGIKFGLGSSQWFIVSAALGFKKDESSLVEVVELVKQTINQVQNTKYPRDPNKPLHFRDLRHEQKKFYTSEIAKRPFKAKSIFLEKSNFLQHQSLITHHNLYSYAVGELVKKILFWCDKQVNQEILGDGTVQLVFSKRTTLKYDFLIAYLEQLFATNPDISNLKAKFFRKERVLALSHGRHAGLQIADAIASSHFAFVEKDAYGQTERTYITNLGAMLLPESEIEDSLLVIPTFENGIAVPPNVEIEHSLLQELKEKAATETKDPTVDQTVATRNPD